MFGYLKLWVLKIVVAKSMDPHFFVCVLKILSLYLLKFVSFRNLWVHVLKS